MKRLYILLVLLIALAMIATACQPQAPAAEEPAAEEPAAEEPAAEEPAAEEVEIKEGLSFAMVTDEAGLGDEGFNDAAWEGMTKSETDFGAEIKVVESREQAQYVPNFSMLAEQEEDLIVAVGFLLQQAVAEVAPLYPDARFALVDTCVDEPNVACVQFKEEEGSYLVGAIAGLMTETNKVGFVGGRESDLLKKFESGYKAGVMTTNPSAEVLVSYTGTFGDPAMGVEMANAQYDQGADVIYEVAGFTGTGVISAAKDRDQMVIAVDRDKNYLAPDNVITSMLKDVGKGVYLVGKMVAEGNFKGGPYRYGVAEGGIGFSKTGGLCPDEVFAVADNLEQMILDGSVAPPTTLDELAAFTPPDVGAEAAPMYVEDLSFAMVTDEAGLGDEGFNDAAWEGMTKSETDFGAEIKVVESREQAQYVPNFSMLAEQEEDLIVAVGFLLQQAVAEVAPQYPDARFALVDTCVDEPNVACVQFKEEEGSYLVGAIAGLMTETNKVGFVGGRESDLLKKFESGYKAGVMTTNPDAEVLVSYTGTFGDPAMGVEMANAQYDQGADVIYEVAGFTGTGVISAAKDRDQMVIAVDRDKNYLAPDNVITSMLKDVGKGVYLVGKMVAEDNFEGGPYRYGVAEGGIGFSKTGGLCPDEVFAVADSLEAMILDGSVAPPTTLDELEAFTPPDV
jgi:basic membrane protein A and related proteins